MRIFPENFATFERKISLLKNLENLEEIFANLIQTPSSEAMVLNPKACGVQVRSPILVGGEVPL